MDAKTFSLGCLTGAIAAFGGLVLLIFLGICLIGSAVSDSMSELADGPVGEQVGCKLPEKKYLYGSRNELAPTVLRVRISGIIANTGRTSLFDLEEDTSARTALRQIRQATKDSSVNGILLELDTPGGEVTYSDVIADALRRFQSVNTNRFVLTHMGGICCSGGYYIAAGSTCIMAHPTTLTGSIGVIMSGINAAGLAEKVGVRSVVIATGENKALLDPLSPVDPKHVEILRKPVQDDYERFLSIVSKGRKLPLETLRPIADGRVLSAADALKLKLIDCIGYRDDATKQLAKLAKGRPVRVCAYVVERPGLLNMFSDVGSAAASPESFMRLVRKTAEEASTPRVEYRMR